MRIDRTELISVRGADGKKIKVIGTSYIYMRDKVSPSWRRVKVVVTESGDNFLLSCSDLKNLDLMTNDFLEYIGQRRGAHASSISHVGEIIDKETRGPEVTEEGCYTSPNNGEEHEQCSDSEVIVKQDESSIELEYEEELSPDQLLAAEA